MSSGLLSSWIDDRRAPGYASSRVRIRVLRGSGRRTALRASVQAPVQARRGADAGPQEGRGPRSIDDEARSEAGPVRAAGPRAPAAAALVVRGGPFI